MDIKALFKDERSHRSLPFWSWNDKLEEAEIRRQVNVMKKANNGGFFMHARGGLETEYLSEEWYKMIGAAIDEAKRDGLDAWAYDENGWPSGFADGVVPARGFEYQQKRISAVILDGDTAPENTVAMYIVSADGYERTEIAKAGVMAVYMVVNKYYIDTFNPDSTKYFLEVTHDEYYKRFAQEFGKTLKGFFTDEPQYNNTQNFPWSHLFEQEFTKRYGYSLIDNLPALFGDYENTFAVRYDFWRMVGDLFRTNFIKQMYDWCHAHNCKLTGHMMCDVQLNTQVRAVADSMSCYEFFDVPGIDWLGRALGHPLAVKQLSSVAAQLQRPTISETFALCGWDVSMNDLRLIAGWQYVNGITMICQHLEAYTLRGLRKRDYPAALFMQLPWYDAGYGVLNTYFSKLGALLSSGEEPAPLLVIHPIYTASLLYRNEDSSDIDKYSDYFDHFSSRLNDEHLLHHYGSEPIMERHGRVEGAELVIGNCRYSSVLIPKVSVITDSTYKLLTEFAENGGKLYAISIPEMIDGRTDARLENLASLCTMIDENDLSVLHEKTMPSLRENGKEAVSIHIAERICGDEKVFYIINLTDDAHTTEFMIDGEYTLSTLDVVSEEECDIAYTAADGKTTATLTFAAREAKVILAQKKVSCYKAEPEKLISFDNNFSVLESTDNMLTLDTCEYKIDGGEWQPERAVICLFSDLLELKRPCKVSMRFSFNVADIPERLCILLETPDQFALSVNGKAFEFDDIGYEIDKAFRKMDISAYVKEGKNEIILDTDFYQSQKVYDVVFGENVHETEKNKLTYDTEIESMYLFGDFAVRSLDEYTRGERKSIFTGHKFEITKRENTVDISDITTSGNLFFAGNMSLAQTVNVTKEQGVRYKVALSALNAPCAELFVNGKRVGLFAFSPYMLDVTDFISDGENEFVFKLYSGNRNMLGPHHRPMGEVHDVGPVTFTDKHGWSDDRSMPAWTDNYSFVEFGIKF